MIEVVCQDCKETRRFSESETHKGLEAGWIIEGEYVTQQRAGSGASDFRDMYVRALLYICKKCRAAGPVNDKKAPVSIEHEAAEYQRLIAEIRKTEPELSIEAAVEKASPIFHDLSRVKHPEFRRYLMERLEVA